MELLEEEEGKAAFNFEAVVEEVNAIEGLKPIRMHLSSVVKMVDNKKNIDAYFQ